MDRVRRNFQNPGSGQRLLSREPRPRWTEKETALSAMWKPSQPTSITPSVSPEPVRPASSSTSFEPAAANRAATVVPADQATIGKGLFIKGEIGGSESLFIDGKVEGSINLPGNRVTVGRNGQVSASISAREIVVLGKVRGNVSASDRVDIRAEDVGDDRRNAIQRA